MVKAILGQKLRMTRMFTDDGRQVALTAIAVGPCPIIQIKTADKDGYNALQVGFQSVSEKKQTQPRLGHFKKANTGPYRILREIRMDSVDGFEIGQMLDATAFEDGDRVDVSGTSKGRGFQGGVRRHNWSGGRKTHGSMFHRRIGAISAGTGQSRIFKGKNLPGHMGNETVTLQNMEVVKVDKDNHIIYVRGGIPGPEGGVVFVKQTTKSIKQKAKES